MRRPNRWWMIGVAAMLIVVAPACTENDLDDSEADVILQVLAVSNPLIAESAGTCSGAGQVECFFDGDCVPDTAGNPTTPCVLPPQLCTIFQWSVTMKNDPLSEGAGTSPFNDVNLTTLTIAYAWGGVVPDFTRVQPLGQTIEAGGTGAVTFFPITIQDVIADQTTVNLTMLFSGSTPAGLPVSVAAGAQLFIENCGVP